MRGALIVCVLLITAIPPPARAVLVWHDRSVPFRVTLAVDRGGQGLVAADVIRTSDAGCVAGRLAAGFVAPRGPDGRIGTPHAVRGLDLLAGPVRINDARFVALAGRTDCRGTALWLVRLDRTGRVVSRSRLAARASFHQVPSFAVGPRGAAAAWIDQRHRQLHVASTLGGDQVIKGTSIARPFDGSYAVTLAAERTGGFLLAWTDPKRAYGLELPGGIRRVLGANHSGFSTMRAALSDRGGAIVAWTSQPQGEEVDGAFGVQIVRRSTGDARFGHVRELADSGTLDEPPDGLQVAASGGRFLVGWGDVRTASGPTGEVDDAYGALLDARGRVAPSFKVARLGTTSDGGQAAGSVDGALFTPAGIAVIAARIGGRIVLSRRTAHGWSSPHRIGSGSHVTVARRAPLIGWTSHGTIRIVRF